jgi:hypothetical protein
MGPYGLMGPRAHGPRGWAGSRAGGRAFARSGGQAVGRSGGRVVGRSGSRAVSQSADQTHMLGAILRIVHISGLRLHS